MDNIERYKKIASALSYATNKGRFTPESVVEIEVDGEVIKVGPFTRFEASINIWEGGAFWQENPVSDKYVIFLGDENWDSWGEMYGNDGVNFRIGVIADYQPIIEEIYENFDVPARMSW